MQPSLGTAVFARTPENCGKSRLAKTWNRPATDIFYHHCLHCAGQWLQAARKLSAGYWALTGKGSRQDRLWQDAEILEQGEGDLGERMAEVAEQLLERHDCWCLAGSDIPQMPPFAELALLERLQQYSFVFGPSLDGGFWLVAGRCPLPRDIWTVVPYSRPDTLEQMMTALVSWDWRLQIDTSLPLLNDVDEYADLVQLRRTLESRNPGLTSAQADLLEWLQAC